MINTVWDICGRPNTSLEYRLVKAVVLTSEYWQEGLTLRVVNELKSGDMQAIVPETFGLQVWSPLMIAALRGNGEVAPLLLTCPTIRNRRIAECALIIAASPGHECFIQALVTQHPSKIPRAIAFGSAIRIGNETIVDILIDGISPLRLALLPLRGGVKSAMGEVALLETSVSCSI